MYVCGSVCPRWKDKRIKMKVAEVSGHLRLPGGTSSCFSTGRVLTGLHRFTWVLAWMHKQGRVHSVALMGQHYSGLYPPHPLSEPWHEAANTTHRQALPSCNHRWHTWSSFPDQFSCPSSCEWRKQHRKNNTSCRPSWGNVALTNPHNTNKKLKGTHCSPPESLWAKEVRLRPERRSSRSQHPHNNNLPIKPNAVCSEIPAGPAAWNQDHFSDMLRPQCLLSTLSHVYF